MFQYIHTYILSTELLAKIYIDLSSTQLLKNSPKISIRENLIKFLYFAKVVNKRFKHFVQELNSSLKADIHMLL